MPIIIVIEDNPDHAHFVKQIFLGLDVINVSCNEEIFLNENGTVSTTEWKLLEDGDKEEIFREVVPDFYVFDVRMPGESGIYIWKKLGSPSKYAFLTLWAIDKYTRSEMESAGIDFDRVVYKGLDNPQTITKLIRNIAKTDGIQF